MHPTIKVEVAEFAVVRVVVSPCLTVRLPRMALAAANLVEEATVEKKLVVVAEVPVAVVKVKF